MRVFHLPRAMLLTVAACVVVLVAALAAQLVLAQQDSADAEIPNLEAQLKERREQSAARMPETAQQITAAQHQKLMEDKILETALNVGDTMPSFALPDASGDTVKSADLLAQGPVVLTFYRGGW